MNSLQMAFGGLLLLLGAFIMFMNWRVVFQWIVKREHSSWIPLVGGSLAAVGLTVIPFKQASTYWWLPLILDWGSLPGIGVTLIYQFWRVLVRQENKTK